MISKDYLNELFGLGYIKIDWIPKNKVHVTNEQLRQKYYNSIPVKYNNRLDREYIMSRLDFIDKNHDNLRKIILKLIYEYLKRPMEDWPSPIGGFKDIPKSKAVISFYLWEIKIDNLGNMEVLFDHPGTYTNETSYTLIFDKNNKLIGHKFGY